MNIILMIAGIAIFAVGLVMTLSDKQKTIPEAASPITDDIAQVEKIKEVVKEVEVREVPASPQPSPVVDESPEAQDPKQKGNDFEDYVANILKANSIRIKEWNKGTVTDEGAFSENALNPDMFVNDKEGKVNLKYWIECKYRSSLGKEGFKLENYQVERYSSIQKSSKRKILVAFGLGGSPSNPNEFYLIPLDTLRRFKHIPEKYLSHYSVANPRGNFKRHVRDYFFDDVFKKSSD